MKNKLILLLFLAITLSVQSPLCPKANPQPLAVKNHFSAKINANPTDKKDEKANIYLNFENATLTSVLNYLAKEKKINILPHKELDTAKVSLTTRNPLTLERAWNVLLTLLEMNNFSIINVDDTYRVVSNKENGMHPLPTYISKNGVEPEDLPDSDLTVRYVYFFNNMKPDVAQNILSTMLEGEGNLQINQDLQACIIKEKCLNIKAAMKIVKELDTGGLREAIKIIPLKETSADTVHELFQQILGTEKEKTLRFVSAETKKDSAFFSSNTKIYPYSSKNALILLGTEKNLNKIINFIYKYIDVPIGSAKSRIHIKEIRYAKAENLKPILENIIKPPPGQGSEKSILVGRYKFFEDVIIAAEEAGSDNMRGGGNRLVIACNGEDWKRLEVFIDKLDKPQPQVAFEVMIIDVGEEQNKALGTQLQASGHRLGMGLNRMQFKNVSSGSVNRESSEDSSDGGNTPASNFIELARPALLGQGSPSFLTLGRTDDANPENNNIWAIIRSVFSVQNSHIIAQPYLVANNYQECNIKISQTRKVSGGIETSKGVTSKTTKVDKEAGTSVILTPQINSNGIVDLKIEVHIDEFVNTPELTEPKIIRRNVNTKATMLAGEVLVLGGLKKSTLETNRYKTPILGDIPILGSLFKSKSKIKTQSNLFVFIRPSIIKPRFEGIPDEYTKLKLDYAKYQMFKMDTYVKDKDPVQRWFFKPDSYTVKQKLADAKSGRFRPVDNFTYGKRQPKSVNIKHDPYFKVTEAIKKTRKRMKKRREHLKKLKTATANERR